MLLGDFDAAEKAILPLLEKYPEEVSYNGVLADIYGAKGEADKALNVYNNLLKKSPENPQVQLSLIEFLQKENRYEDLMGFLNTVMINSNIAKDDKVSILLKLYDDSTLINNYSSSLELTVLVLETQYKDDSVVMILRPELYQKEGRLVEAISKFDAYIKKYPDNYFAWERLLLLYSDTKDYERLVSVGRECTTKFNMSILACMLQVQLKWRIIKLQLIN
jgi:tetratricopeptide (TPR) repeat protein